jgi:hypothetical protein
MKTRHALFFLYLFFVPPCFAQSVSQNLPDKPQPAGRVADREFWAEAGAMGAAWTADTITTAHDFSQSPLDHEGGYLFNGSRSTAKVMGAWAAVDVGAAVAAYEWKKHVHNRYLHPLWRVPMAFMAVNHNEAMIHNLTTKTK